jgi:hypothetical protein
MNKTKMNLIELVNPTPTRKKGLKVILLESQAKRLIQNLKNESKTENTNEKSEG